MEHYCTGMPDSKSRDPEKIKKKLWLYHKMIFNSLFKNKTFMCNNLSTIINYFVQKLNAFYKMNRFVEYFKISKSNLEAGNRG